MLLTRTGGGNPSGSEWVRVWRCAQIAGRSAQQMSAGALAAFIDGARASRLPFLSSTLSLSLSSSQGRRLRSGTNVRVCCLLLRRDPERGFGGGEESPGDPPTRALRRLFPKPTKKLSTHPGPRVCRTQEASRGKEWATRGAACRKSSWEKRQGDGAFSQPLPFPFCPSVGNGLVCNVEAATWKRKGRSGTRGASESLTRHTAITASSEKVERARQRARRL